MKWICLGIVAFSLVSCGQLPWSDYHPYTDYYGGDALGNKKYVPPQVVR